MFFFKVFLQLSSMKKCTEKSQLSLSCLGKKKQKNTDPPRYKLGLNINLRCLQCCPVLPKQKSSKRNKENISVTSNTQKKLYIAPTLPNCSSANIFNIKIYPDASVITIKLYNIHSILLSGMSITST